MQLEYVVREVLIRSAIFTALSSDAFLRSHTKTNVDINGLVNEALDLLLRKHGIWLASEQAKKAVIFAVHSLPLEQQRWVLAEALAAVEAASTEAEPS